MTPTDIAIVDLILMAAYASPGSFQEELSHYLVLQPDGWFIALLDGRPVGAGGVVNYGPFSYLGLIAILPDQQRRGIGRALTEHLLTWLSRQQCPIALLEASPAGAPLYSKLGFQVDDTTLVFQLAGPAPHAQSSTATKHYQCHPERSEGSRVPQAQSSTATEPHQCHPERSEGSRVPHAPSSIVIEPLQSTDLAELIALDAPQFGANRSNVFSIYLARYSERCFVSRNPEGYITGCIVGQADALGPWIAHSHEEAEALLAHALTLAFQHPPRIRVPASNHRALALVQAYGFRETRALKHMRRGGIQHPQQREHIYALATLAIG